jgi:hypothetical protein
MKSISFFNKNKKLSLLSLASLGLAGYSYLDRDTYYLLIGVRRGARSIYTGLKIIANYYIVCFENFNKNYLEWSFYRNTRIRVSQVIPSLQKKFRDIY